MTESPALAPDDRGPWQDLPPELVPRILARLPTNEVPCTARLVCKAVAAELSSPEHTTVRLSQPSPHGEFARRWGAPGAMRPLTLIRRRRLLCLTAASGCLHNLTWLAERVGCLPDDSALEDAADAVRTDSVLEAAAAAGRPEACRWLLQQGCTDLLAALAAAAGAGQRSTLEALLADPGAQNFPDHLGEGFRATSAICAARGGHVGLADWLLERLELKLHDLEDLLAAAAAGCDLATLQRLILAHQPHPAQQGQERPGRLGRRMGFAAASSPTPDWRAKVEWLETCLGAPLLDETACADAAACPDALERLTWLRARGCPWDWQAVDAAAGAGNVEALSYLLAEGCSVNGEAIRAAASGGHLAALEVLHSHGLAGTNLRAWDHAARSAARGGQLSAVRWMLERQLVNLQPLEPGVGSLLGCAAESGSVELLTLLHACGCCWDEGDLYAAARGGSEEALEWAVAQGCPAQESIHDDPDNDPYFIAARQGDWATLACLRRLSVPWRPLNLEDGTFAAAVREGCSVPILRRLLELGCPVDWVRAAEAARSYRHEDVWTWVEEEERQRARKRAGYGER